MFIAILFYINRCTSGNKVPTEKTEYSIILNSGSAFVFTFKDSDTNVWYIASDKGVTPRHNQDGSLYVK